MKAAAFLFATLVPVLLAAQQLLVPASAEVQDELVFNPAFVARNSVRSISGTLLVKREGQPMRERNEKHLYRFDEQGRITYSNISFGHPGSGRDTASVGFFYDAKGSYNGCAMTSPATSRTRSRAIRLVVQHA